MSDSTPETEIAEVEEPAKAPVVESAGVSGEVSEVSAEAVTTVVFAEPEAQPQSQLELEAQLEPQPKPERKRRFPWRWVGAFVTMAAVGAGCAFGVMAPQRTDLPGLKTASDGRYDFAPLTLPTLAAGQSDPNSSANGGGQHISDIRELLLQPPRGAAVDHSLPGASGWISHDATLTMLNNPLAGMQLATDGWRHTAGTAWKTADGTSTKIYLLQFTDSSAASDADAAFAKFAGNVALNLTFAAPNQTTAFYAKVTKGSTTTWYGELNIDDADALIVFTAPTSVGMTPFEQEVDLQSQLLQ